MYPHVFSWSFYIVVTYSVGDNNSKIAQHVNQFGHSIDFDQAFSLRPGILCETEMRAMNILMFQEFIAHSRDLFSRAVIVRNAL